MSSADQNANPPLRTRCAPELHARIYKIGANATLAQRRPVTQREVNQRLLDFAVEHFEKCPTCQAATPCEIHWPAARMAIARAAKGVAPSARRYAEAYAAGQTDATGEAFTPPLDSQAQHVFRTALPAHFAGLAGERLDTAIRESSAAFRRAQATVPEYTAGYSPKAWQRWLDGGRPTAGKRKATTRQVSSGPRAWRGGQP